MTVIWDHPAILDAQWDGKQLFFQRGKETFSVPLSHEQLQRLATWLESTSTTPYVGNSLQLFFIEQSAEAANEDHP